jgi:hypothetical protein
MAIAAFLGWLGLGIQFYLMLIQSPPGGMAIAATIVSYFSFFTILTNLLTAVVLTLALNPYSRGGKWASRPSVQAATAVYIAIVGITYSLLLRDLWNPQGLQKFADVLLHDVMPILYVLYWLIFARKDGLRAKDAVIWLVYPAVYSVYLLVRGAIFGLYPYPFIDVRELGYPRMLANAALFVGFFLGVGLIAVAISRWLPRRNRVELTTGS